ncbi:tetratricopeptide repeat protein [Porcipelethomonas sp.]|uniref:tetratricopeptide repeat protein n=1 Tax=Porcipelethomonas sp. TaxID=2981675 RepID=UPI003EFA2BDC
MKSKMLTIISVIIIAAIAILTVYAAFIAEEKDYRLIAKAVIVMVSYILALMGFKRKGSINYGDYRVYKDKYKDIINDAFEHDSKSYKQLMKAIHMFNIDKDKEALKILNKLEDSCVSISDHSAVLTFKALVLRDQNMSNAAAETYEELLKSDVSNSRAWSNLGLIYYEQGRTAEACRAYENAVTYNPDNAYAYCNLASFYVNNNEPQKALENAMHALEINGKLYQAMSAASVACKLLGDDEMSEKYFKMYGTNGGDTKNLRQVLENISA